MSLPRTGLPLHWLMLAGFAIGLSTGLIAHVTAGPEAAWVLWLTENVTGPIGQI